MYQVAGGPDMFRPWHHVTCEDHVRPGLEAHQAAFFDQLIAKETESKSSLVVAEVRSGYLTKPSIGNTRTVAVAPLETKIDRSADSQRKKVCIRKQSRRQYLGQDIQRGEGHRIAHQRQLDEFLDVAPFEP